MITLRERKIPFFTLAILAYLLPFSSRLLLEQYSITGASVENDFTRVFIFGIDIAVLLAAAILSATVSDEQPIEKRPIIFLCIFILWLVISSLTADVQTWLSYAFIVRITLAAILFTQLLKLPASAIFSLTGIGLVLSGVVQTFLGLTQFIMGKSLGLGFLGESPLAIGQPNVATFTAFGEKFLRAYGTMPHPNILAFFLMTATMASFAFFLIFKDKRSKMLSLAGLLVNATGLFLTFSRGFIVLTAFGLVLMYLIKHPARTIFKRVARSAAGLALVLVVLVGITTLRPVDSDQSLNLRSVFENISAEQSADNMIVGVGPGQSVLQGNSYLRSYLDKNQLEYQAWLHQPVHSTYLLFSAETGWVGVTLFLLFIILATDNMFKILRKNKKAHQNTFFVFACIASALTLTAMLFEHLFITNPNSLYLTFILLALLVRGKSEITILSGKSGKSGKPF